MKSASPALTNFLLNIQDRVPETTANFWMEDLYSFILGNAFIVVNFNSILVGGTYDMTANLPTIGTNTSVFLVDLGVKEQLNYAPLTWIPSGSPAIGQYTVNNSTGVYTFNASDSGNKLISYGFYIGPVVPQVFALTSGMRDISYAGTTYQGGNDFSTVGVISRSKLKTTIGLAVDQVDCTLNALPTMQIPNGVPILTAMAQGYFDGASVLIQRIIMPTYGDTSLGTIIQFKGTVGDVTEMGRTHCKFQIRSRLELLNTPLPRNLLSPSCRHVLYDAGCLLSQNSFSTSGIIQTGSNMSQIITNLTQPAQAPGPTSNPSLSLASPAGVNLNARIEWVRQTYVYSFGESLPGPEVNSGSISGAKLLVVASPGSAPSVLGWNCYIGDAPGDEQLQNGSPISIGTPFTENVNGFTTGSPVPILATNGYYSQGVVVFTSGLNSGLQRVVQTYTNNGSNNVLNIIPPLPNMPSAGDTFTVSAGCDKRSSTCNLKFSNLLHFGGFSYIPDPSITV